MSKMFPRTPQGQRECGPSMERFVVVPQFEFLLTAACGNSFSRRHSNKWLKTEAAGVSFQLKDEPEEAKITRTSRESLTHVLAHDNTGVRERPRHQRRIWRGKQRRSKFPHRIGG